MSMRSGWLAVCAVGLLAFLVSCGSSSKTGVVYLASQGTQSVGAYKLNLHSGLLNSTNGQITPMGTPAATGAQPTALIFDPKQTFAYVADFGSNDIASFSVGKDGTLTSVAKTPITVGTRPVALAMDPGGKFLFVADQGTPQDPNCGPHGVDPTQCTGRISVFSVGSNAALTEVAGSPFQLLTAAQVSSFAVQVAPSAVAVSNQKGFVYVTDLGNAIVAGFAFDGTTGALTPVAGSPFAVGTAPSAVISPPTTNSSFLYVANAQTNNIDEFTINADGSLSAVAGSPVGSGNGPMALFTDPTATYLYSVDNVSNSLSGYRINTVVGSLTPLTQPTISTGSGPVAATVRFDGESGGNYWVIVSNLGNNTVSTFSLTTSTGVLNALPQLVTPVGPYGIASR